MNRKSKVPQLRFPEFTDDWVQRKLEELCDFERGQGLSWSDIDDSDGKNECILYGNLYTDYDTVIEKVKHKTNIKGTVRSKKFDVLIPGSDTTPTGLARALCVVNDGVILGGDINILHPHVDVEGRFLAFALNSRKKELIKRIKGTTVRHLQNKDLFDVLVNIPKSKEQEKIAELLLSFDHLITLHQRKLDNLNSIKKSMLDKLFPKKGEKYPEVRFEGFTGEWEQRKLSDEFSNFIVPMRDKPKEFGGNIPWTRIEDIEGKYLNGSLSGQYVTEETVKKMNLKIIPKDSLIVSSSATFGVVAVVTNDLITNQTFIGLVPNDKETLDYWYSYFQSDEARMYMKLQSAGSTIFYIAREHFENMPITVPTKKEMLKIGTFFSNLDDLITLHQRKLDNLYNIKKGFLQQMFV